MTKWVLEKNGKEILDEIEYSDDDLITNGASDVLWALIPLEMTDEAEKGEWDYIGFSWIFNGDFYTIRRMEQK